MSRLFCSLAAALLAFSAALNAATIRFESDPFAGSDALTTPGRQVVGNELFVSFNIASDVYSFEPSVFGGITQALFENDVAANLPASGVNVIVLRTFDNDNDPATAFGAGNAANLIAAQITAPGPGFFIYFNSGLDLPRLVYSTNLDDNTADLKILARMTNLGGQAGRDAFPSFTEGNFVFASIPEPSSVYLMSAAGVLWALAFARRRRRVRG
jgi:hypothetical protein